ncbi:MAG: Smr/MutS family protein [Pseudomonadota bacterium]|nr:Smr/MutS family protein [Pseudomonadota bacterium]
MRKLSAEEEALWSRVAATIRPLSREPLHAAATDVTPEPMVAPPVPGPPRGRVPPVRQMAVLPRSRPTLQAATLDGGWDRRLRAGEVQPDRTLDLHGHNLDRAWEAIDRQLDRSIAAGDRVLLFITGHERQGEPPVARGRIRAAVNDWLAASRHSARIAAVRPAHRRHGGGGSLYIILRK